ncbi:MAG TPA: spore coat U domain-containing protein [Rhodanobacteraceae bacterium]|nr:spore coat U domain-containing protein [Rhodanobacteraceae bacterium]
MQLKTALLAAALATAGFATQSFDTANAATTTTVTNSMPVKITIQNACDVSTTAPTTLDFGTQGPLISNIDNTSSITVTCTTSAPYNVGLDGGSSGSVTARTMLKGTTPVNYALYRDASRTLNWGNTVGTDTLAGTGSGSAQTLTVYGRVPPQTTPAAGVYNDTVTVSVTY